MPVLTIPAPRQPRRATLTAKIKNTAVGIAATPKRSSLDRLYGMLYPHSALSDFILDKGEQTETHWGILSFRLHLAATLLQLYAPHEAQAADVLRDGIHHLITAQAVHERTGKWRLTRVAQRCVGQGLHYADDLQELVTRPQERAAGIALVKACLHDLKRLGMTDRMAQRILAA